MKKCPYCGKEYPDDVKQCLIDGEILLDKDSPALSSMASSTSQSGIRVVPSFAVLTDRQIRIIEITLVCAIAFGVAILTSTYSFFNSNYGTSGRSAFAWLIQTLREILSLALLWYVLGRRNKTFSDLGLSWAWKDVGWAILLGVGTHLVYQTVYEGIYYAGLTSATRAATSDHVGQILFGGGITLATFLFQFVNPFFEELIARAYVMSEVKALTGSMTKAIIASTALQTSYHFYQGAPAALADGAMFLIFSIYYAKTKRIAPIILAHLYADVHGTLWYLFHH